MECVLQNKGDRRLTEPRCFHGTLLLLRPESQMENFSHKWSDLVGADQLHRNRAFLTNALEGD